MRSNAAGLLKPRSMVIPMFELLLKAIGASRAVSPPVRKLADAILEELRNDPEVEQLKRDIDSILQEEEDVLKKPRPQKRAAARRTILAERQQGFRGTQKRTLSDLTKSLQQVTSAYNDSMSKELERAINTFRYHDFGSLKDNKEAAKQIQQLVKRVGFRFKDPKSGKAANLICKESKSNKNGLFYFEYYEDGRKRTGASSTCLPHMQVIPSEDEDVLIADVVETEKGMFIDEAA